MKVKEGEIWYAQVYDKVRVVEVINIHKGEVTEVIDNTSHKQYFNDKESNIQQFTLLQPRLKEEKI